MREGYCVDMGAAYYCSDDCLHTEYTEEEWAEECENNDLSFYTEWQINKFQQDGRSSNNDLQGNRYSQNSSDLWNTLQKMNVNTKNIWLDELAKYYGIDYEAKHISVRGHIYWAEYEEDEENDNYLLSFCTETAWDEIGRFRFHPILFLAIDG